MGPFVLFPKIPPRRIHPTEKVRVCELGRMPQLFSVTLPNGIVPFRRQPLPLLYYPLSSPATIA
jgi:hypothetical protein